MKPDQYKITNYKFFKTTERAVLNTSASFRKWINNPTPKDKKDGTYKPRLTLIKRGRLCFLKIEFSAPKILFGDNLNELNEDEFRDVIKALRLKMSRMGVLVWEKDLEESAILSFHPSKNITLTDGYTANFAIRELNKIDFSKRFDLDKKDFGNSGDALQFYTVSHSLVIYDKISDLIKPKRRAIDKDKTIQQPSLFNLIKDEYKGLEILRLEVRLSSKRKMNEQLKRLGYFPNPTFLDIFKQDICQKIVSQYWYDFFGDNQFVFNIINSPQDILQIVLRKHPDIKVIKAINIIGLYTLCRDDEGMRGFRKIIDSYKAKSNWPTVSKYIEILNDEVFSSPTWGFVEGIKQQLRCFEPFRLNS